MAIVELKNVAKRYASQQGSSGSNAVDNFNLVTRDGEFVVLVGPSGCGKSTTMRMIAGLERNTEGEILIGGRDVSQVPPKERDIAMVFQSYALYPHMSVADNMGFSLKLKKRPAAEIKAKIEEAAQTLGIEPLLDRKPRELSGGQRQRVALGRAIVRDPQVFLMDEPLSNLDAKLRVDMRAEIVKLHKRLKVTTFYVTHDQVEAMTMGERIVVMKDGRIQQIDTPINLYEFPANRFVAGFIGNPSMNFLRAKHAEGVVSGDGYRLALDDAHRSSMASRGAADVWVGIRPEHLRLGDATDTNRIEGKVEVVETLGAVTMVQLSVGEHFVSAQLPGHRKVEIDDTLTLACDSDKLHLFDTDSELAIGRESASQPSTAVEA
ncbi:MULTISPECIES: sn-glycerol-3-phosphate ABC transporter ATP-binding protein UgpC [Salinicola]|uniref:Glycerol-3-phosphate ABC transporter ATP-binding protein n=1 Tax=Salinicola socius TaxID=404433 RepID=A0A1Q8STL0_9GAMM|nr:MULTISPECIES: sn-glycerol-3-phosphate ABC transporter ATP-binding protein UgpC [Salinicola]OLO04712.1 glycerol-3-phosphate ABC transporter ATP-binding protein [Salinicola socius]